MTERKMTETNKWISLVSKLLQTTQMNEITWTLTSPPDSLLPSGERAEKVYERIFMQNNFRLYEYHYKYWTDEERFDWTDGTKLEFIDLTGRSLFEVSNVEGMNDLLDAARYQSADIDQVLQSLPT